MAQLVGNRLGSAGDGLAAQHVATRISRQPTCLFEGDEGAMNFAESRFDILGMGR